MLIFVFIALPIILALNMP